MAKPCPSSGVHFNSTKNVLLAASALASARNAKHKKTIEMATSINGSTGPSHGSPSAGANDRKRTKELIALVVILMGKPWKDQRYEGGRVGKDGVRTGKSRGWTKNKK